MSTREHNRDSSYGLAAARRRSRFADYDRCPDCGALPGNPCREMYGVGHRITQSSPHHSRPKREEAR